MAGCSILGRITRVKIEFHGFPLILIGICRLYSAEILFPFPIFMIFHTEFAETPILGRPFMLFLGWFCSHSFKPSSLSSPGLPASLASHTGRPAYS